MCAHEPAETSDPCRQGAQLAALIPVARFETIPGAGYLVPEDTPAELAASIMRCLATLVGLVSGDWPPMAEWARCCGS